MTVPSGRPPHETGVRVASAGDSVVPVRHVLGTVPVEEDGSAHFTVPANIEVFFQALDDHGLAVQSMRSATQLHAGERLVCAGCHQPSHHTVDGQRFRSPGPPASSLADQAGRGRLASVQLSAARAAGAGPALCEVSRATSDRHPTLAASRSRGTGTRPTTVWSSNMPFTTTAMATAPHPVVSVLGHRRLYQAASARSLRREALRRRTASPDPLARLLVDVLRRLRRAGRRSPTAR